MTDAQRIRVRELASALREDHETVRVRGARITVPGSRIAATVEPDGGAWLTWADGTRTYTPTEGDPNPMMARPQVHTPDNATAIAADAQRAPRYTLTEDMRIQDATGRILPLSEVIDLLNRADVRGNA